MVVLNVKTLPGGGTLKGGRMGGTGNAPIAGGNNGGGIIGGVPIGGGPTKLTGLIAGGGSCCKAYNYILICINLK